MRSIGVAITSIAITLFLCVTGHARDERPEVPFIQRDVCPFECCQFGRWTARSPLKAHEKEDDNAAIAFTIKPDEEFIALRGNVHIMKSGVLILEESAGNFSKGDKVYILSYRGEGDYDLWYKGKMLAPDSDDLSKVLANSKLVNSPEFVWWVMIKNKDGKEGWLRLKNITDMGFQTEEQFDGADACG